MQVENVGKVFYSLEGERDDGWNISRRNNCCETFVYFLAPSFLAM